MCFSLKGSGGWHGRRACPSCQGCQESGTWHGRREGRTNRGWITTFFSYFFSTLFSSPFPSFPPAPLTALLQRRSIASFVILYTGTLSRSFTAVAPSLSFSHRRPMKSLAVLSLLATLALAQSDSVCPRPYLTFETANFFPGLSSSSRPRVRLFPRASARIARITTLSWMATQTCYRASNHSLLQRPHSIRVAQRHPPQTSPPLWTVSVRRPTPPVLPSMDPSFPSSTKRVRPSSPPRRSRLLVFFMTHST